MSQDRPLDYYHINYNLTMPHSEVVDAMNTVKPCRTFDLGCGQGRNSLYLNSMGFDLTSVDVNPDSIRFLKEVMAKEEIDTIAPSVYDINNADIQGQYDFIVSTVVFMFLNSDRVPDIIRNMQEHTNIGGYNLIVSAMDTEQYPCNQGFSFTFKEGELKAYYKDWEMVRYNEDVGELHRTDQDGNRVKLQFATMLAKRIR